MRLSVIAMAGGIVLTAAAQAADTPAGSAERGKKAYMEHLCYTCHGTVGQGGDRGAGPRIAPNPFPYVAFVQHVRKPRQVMPPYTDKVLPDQDLADIYAYIVAIKPSPAAKDIPLLRDF